MLTRFIRTLLVPVSRLAFRPEVEGCEHVPREGPVILAANHLSFVDSFLIPLVAPRPVVFLAKSEYFTGTGVRGRLTGAALRGLGAVAVPRGEHRAAQAALETALGVLREGQAFGIHPEGSRSRDGRLYKGRTGVAWLALASGAPVVPVALLGTERIQPVGARLPRPGKVTVRFGAPMWFTTPTGNPGQIRRDVTDQIMAEIEKLSGQETAGRYNELSAGR